jgi:hypothetical protein
LEPHALKGYWLVCLDAGLGPRHVRQQVWMLRLQKIPSSPTHSPLPKAQKVWKWRSVSVCVQEW